MNENLLAIVQSDLEHVKPLIEAHLNTFTYPMDSYLEFRLSTSKVYEIVYNGNRIGYAGFNEEVLSYFHVLIEYYDFAPEIFESLINAHHVTRVYVNTQDPLFVALISEWDYEKKNDSCWFIDGKNNEKSRNVIEGTTIRLAKLEDIDKIAHETNPFFDSLEERVQEQTLFMLEKDNELLGCGLIEKGVFFNDCVSIGMITCKAYRHRGIGQNILWHMKEWAYNNGFKPIAGCSYSNTLSRKTLEKAGMVVIGIGYEAILTGKDY